MRVLAPSLLFLLFFSGCASISSVPIGDLANVDRPPEGVQYSLPLGLVPFYLEVVPKTGQFIFSAGTPVYTPDPHNTYVFEYLPRVNYDDDITITTNNKSFLSKANSKTKDQTGAIIVQIAKTISALQEVYNSVEVAEKERSPIDDTLIDVADHTAVREMMARFNQKAAQYAKKAQRRCAKKDIREANDEACAEYDRVAANAAEGRPLLTLRLDPPPNFQPLRKADCKEGLCYRAAQSVGLRLSVNGGSTSSGVVELPNFSPLIGIDIRRAVLIEKLTEISFDPNTGLLQSVHINKPSEALEAAKLPLAITQAVLSAPTEILQLKINYDSKQEELAKAQADAAKAQNALDQLNNTPEQPKTTLIASAITFAAPPLTVADKQGDGKSDKPPQTPTPGVVTPPSP